MALSTAMLLGFGCATGGERLSDDVADPIDARASTSDGALGDGAVTDARVDASSSTDGGSTTDAASSVDAGGTGVECPADLLYYFRAIEALSLPSPPFCTTGAECSSAECCYGGLVCVGYP